MRVAMQGRTFSRLSGPYGLVVDEDGDEEILAMELYVYGSTDAEFVRAAQGFLADRIGRESTQFQT